MQVINRYATLILFREKIAVEVSILKNEIDNVVHFIFSADPKHYAQLSSVEPVKATSDLKGNLIKLAMPEKNEKLIRFFTMHIKRYIKDYFKEEELSAL